MHYLSTLLLTAGCIGLPTPSSNKPGIENSPVPQTRTVYHIDFFDNNSTEPPLEIIPSDSLCEFCFVVITGLKQMQKDDPHFEQKMKSDCQKHSNKTHTDACKYVNKVNLSKLSTETPSKICSDHKMCSKEEAEKEQSLVDEKKVNRPSPDTKSL